MHFMRVDVDLEAKSCYSSSFSFRRYVFFAPIGLDFSGAVFSLTEELLNLSFTEFADEL
jgi:hypothetical protein